MLTHECDDLDLVRKAQLGDRDSLTHLAETARVRLYEYVFRLTLTEDLAQDIVQETILEMLRLLGRLRKADRFWAWLYGIAFNKVRGHYGRQWRHKTRPLPESELEPAGRADNDVLAGIVTEELKQIVLGSIQALEPRHRAVLTMRCYDHLSYAEIGRLMGCSEIGTRALFYRAKKALAHQLSHHGLSKGALLLALVAFGKMTAVSQASAAQVSVPAATLAVGPLGTLLGAATSKAAVVIFTVAAVSVGGSIVATRGPVASPSGLSVESSRRPPLSWLQTKPVRACECWYYFPDGPDKSVMMRLVESDRPGRNPVCLILENQHANYYFRSSTNTVYVRNHHVWQEDLGVRRLPTDPPELTSVLARLDSGPSSVSGTGPRDSSYTPAQGKGLLIVCDRSEDGQDRIRQTDRHPFVLQEEYFQFGWPQSARVVDQRDSMHHRGWTYVRLRGQINDETVTGTARLPFVYAASRAHYPWLDLRLGRERRAVDGKDGAVLYGRDGRIIAQYAAGSLLKGLARPWMGLHAIDTIRRDAAEQRLPFETRYDGEDTACVTVQAGSMTLVYTINMHNDVIERIGFHPAGPNTAGAPSGALEFVYLQDIDGTSAEFIEPRVSTSGVRRPYARGMLWLTQLLGPQNE
jgi:RNA polymerase sigma-70 factor (ECF subfamily)